MRAAAAKIRGRPLDVARTHIPRMDGLIAAATSGEPLDVVTYGKR
jgi:hypothetical protein